MCPISRSVAVPPRREDCVTLPFSEYPQPVKPNNIAVTGLRPLTIQPVFRIIKGMNDATKKLSRHIPDSLRRCAAIAICLSLTVFLVVSCGSTPDYPAPQPPITDTLPVGFKETFKSTYDVLNNDERLVLHTVDNAGRFIAWEKTSGIIFFQHRTILDIRLEPLDTDKTKITIFLSAEEYDWGGFTLAAGWYPSSKVDTFLGQDILNLIKTRAEASA